MNNVHPAFAFSLRSIAPPSLLEAQLRLARAAIKDTSPPTLPIGEVEYELFLGDIDEGITCRFEFNEGEAQTRDDPGWPPSMTLCSAWLRGVDISSILSDKQVETLEANAFAES